MLAIHALFTSGANFAFQKISHPTSSLPFDFALTFLLFAMSYVLVQMSPKRMS